MLYTSSPFEINERTTWHYRQSEDFENQKNKKQKMKWQKIINGIENQNREFRINEPNLGASKIESEFKIKLPSELINLYKETDGIDELLEGEKIGDLIWNVKKVIQENREFRTNQNFIELYMPFDCLLFIGGAGNGDNFGYSIQENKISRTDIYAWNHEDDSRIWVAPNMEMFVKWWAVGKIKI